MSNQLPTDYQAFIHKSRYAKYFDGKGRESWGETVGRYMDNVVRKALGIYAYIYINQYIHVYICIYITKSLCIELVLCVLFSMSCVYV